MSVMVTVEEPYRGSLESIVDDLASAGLSKAEKIGSTVICGEVAESNLAKLHRVQGVRAVEQEPIFDSER